MIYFSNNYLDINSANPQTNPTIDREMTKASPIQPREAKTEVDLLPIFWVRGPRVEAGWGKLRTCPF